MSHTFTAEQTVYWKQQAYALMVQEGMSARFAKGQVETERFLDDIMLLVRSSGNYDNKNAAQTQSAQASDQVQPESAMFKLGFFIGRLAV